MMRAAHILRCAALLALAAALPLQAQMTGKRMALVIGNDAYPQSPLKNAVNDAYAMKQALEGTGFQTTVVVNGKKAEMEAAIGEFLDRIGPDDVVLFFYAGHGVQIEDENFLVPVDFPQAGTVSAAKFACVPVAQLFDELKRKHARQNIVILDACRTNPLTAKYSLSAGLAKPQALPNETYVIYSTGPGKVATDNPDGRNSWFTEALADYISQPNLTVDISELIKRVAKRVSDATSGLQVPYEDSNLTARFFFHIPANGDTETDSNLLQKWMDDAATHEQHGEWTEAIELVNRVVQRKPGGALEELAKRKVLYLGARKDAQAKFDAGDYAAAATFFEQALKADPFSGDAAMLAADCYLLLDQLPPGVTMLGAIRQRGTADAVERAEAMLKELAAVSPEAAKEAQAPTPQPPPFQELFGGTTFGVPDWDAGKRRAESVSIDITPYTKDLKMEVPMPALIAVPAPETTPAAPAPPPPAADQPANPPAAPTPAAAAIAAAIFHIDVVQVDARNLKLRAGAAQDQEFGYLVLDGVSPETPISLDGQVMTGTGKLKLAAGKYEIRMVDGGKVIDTKPVEVKPLSIQTYKVTRQ